METYDNRLHFPSFWNKTSELSVIRLEVSRACDRTCLAAITQHACIGCEFVELMNWATCIQGLNN